ncbi:TPA: hypothetical protein IAA86_07140 [Candidatus Galligastranaerophilus intestinavium]|uniref:FlgN protein n=1 Tax=Candidatus Galligastranaerophilus intestinavium TaxID=2840836 RepID=A0A9D1FJS1_9BACT|nr:hypothetical protein [Candidatus Galligastranaerophilus intestinavium]
MEKITFEKILEIYLTIKNLLKKKQQALIKKDLEMLASCDENLICAYNEVKNIYENKDKFTLSDEQKKQLNEITAQIGHLQKNNEVLITHSLNVINKIFEGILNITSAKNADYNHLGKKNQDSGLDISSITGEA